MSDGTVKEYRYDSYKKSDIPTDTIAALIRAYRISPKWVSLAASTKYGYGHYLSMLEAATGSGRVVEFTRRYALALRDDIAHARGSGAATAFVTACAALFSWAVDNEWIDNSPLHRVKGLPGGHLPAWTDEQAARALSGLPEHFRRAVILGLYTGQRRGDLCAVRWSAYSGTEIRFIQQKTGVELVLTVHPELKRELDTWERTAVTILTCAHGRPWNAKVLSATLPRAMRQIGLPRGLNVHGLRKLFAASIANAGGTTHQISAGTGHQTLAMVSLYTKSANQRKLGAEAVRLLPKFGRDGK